MLLQLLWRWSVNELIATSTIPHLDAELLLAAALGLTRAQLYSQTLHTTLSVTQVRSIKMNINRRKAGEPIAYLLAQQEFWSLLLEVNPAVLIPRPETELLVQLLLLNDANSERKIADLGTGSGAIALALASERPNWQIVATDCSRDALQVAERNRSRYDLKNVELRQGDWCDAFQRNEYFDMIVSNPPYLVNNDPHFQTELGLVFEPKMALFAGENGLYHIETIIRESRHHLLSEGTLFLEHGFEQAALVSRLFLEYGYHKLQHYKDLAGQQRVISGKWH